MKLRNKITGKICDAEAREDGIYLKTDWGDGEKWHKYGLGCLGDNYEYCAEPKEPLIEDEQIRKIIRAWAEENDSTRAVYHSPKNELADSYGNSISFNLIFKELNHGAEYTIAELCGDSEEDKDEA